MRFIATRNAEREGSPEARVNDPRVFVGCGNKQKLLGNRMGGGVRME